MMSESRTTAVSTVRRLLLTAGLGGVAAAGLVGPGAANAYAAESCPDVEVVFARGTAEPAGLGRVGDAFVQELGNDLGGQSVDVYAVNYPASYDFLQSAPLGADDASAHIQATVTSCPDTSIVLGGYSQGAAVAGYTTTDSVPAGTALPDGVAGTLPPAVAAHVAAVVLFGTPSDGFLGMVAHDAPPITIGHLFAAKTLELCNPGDPVCFPGGMDRSAHSAYKTNGTADQAADFAAHALTTRA
jgi:cutinase